jgi:hypothetical protein
MQIDRRTSPVPPHMQHIPPRDERRERAASLAQSPRGAQGFSPSQTSQITHTHARTHTHSPPTDRAPARVLLAFRPRACLPPDSSRAALVTALVTALDNGGANVVCIRCPTAVMRSPLLRAQEHAPRSTRPGARAQEHAHALARAHSPARAGEGLARMLVVLLAQRAHRLKLLPVRQTGKWRGCRVRCVAERRGRLWRRCLALAAHPGRRSDLPAWCARSGGQLER